MPPSRRCLGLKEASLDARVGAVDFLSLSFSHTFSFVESNEIDFYEIGDYGEVLLLIFNSQVIEALFGNQASVFFLALSTLLKVSVFVIKFTFSTFNGTFVLSF